MKNNVPQSTLLYENLQKIFRKIYLLSIYGDSAGKRIMSTIGIGACSKNVPVAIYWVLDVLKIKIIRVFGSGPFEKELVHAVHPIAAAYTSAEYCVRIH